MIDLGKIKPDHFIGYLFLSLSLVVPGAGYIYLSDPELFKELELVKLILLSLLYSLPIVLLAFVYTVERHITKKSRLATEWIAAATGLLALFLFFLTTWTYLKGVSYSYAETLYAGSFIAIIAYVFLKEIWKGIKKLKK